MNRAMQISTIGMRCTCGVLDKRPKQATATIHRWSPALARAGGLHLAKAQDTEPSAVFIFPKDQGGNLKGSRYGRPRHGPVANLASELFWHITSNLTDACHATVPAAETHQNGSELAGTSFGKV